MIEKQNLKFEQDKKQLQQQLSAATASH